MLTLNTDITKINRVGALAAKRLKKLGIETVEDLLFYFPFRYDDFSKITLIKDLKIGASANIVGQIELIENRRSRRRRMYITEALISDESDTIKVIWFNQPFIARNLRVGDYVSLAGKVEDDYGAFVMMSPVYEKINPPNPLYQGGVKAIHTQGLVPNYHLTANITHKQVRFLIKQIIGLADKVIDWLPMETKKNLKLLNLGEAIKKIHFPRSWDDVNKAKRRLAFNELFLIQMQSQLIRRDAKFCVSTPIKFFESETKKFVEDLPFKLTNAQRKAAWEIIKDMEKDKPMARLLEGDVGSGKTVVAIVAMLNVVLNKKQAVLMAPTEILARQHYESVKNFLGDNLSICLLTRSQFSIFNFQFSNKSKNFKISKQDVLDNVKNGQADIIIGTHSLIQEDVSFKNLALAVIDEQHRFGVEQRKMLVEKAGGMDKMLHLLTMTATPIPRSLALALYGDLDISIINEMPLGRKKIFTKVVPEEKREKAYQFIREQVKAGRQVFVICPLIDLSDKLGVKSVKEEFKKLDEKVFPEIKMCMLHGRMKTREKEGVMKKFLAGEIKILVSTSVVEVGVDAPNASIIMIEGADRFGLAQLHQFRGRVGRSEHQSYCFLFTPHHLTAVPTASEMLRSNGAGFTESDADKTLKRLNALVDCNDGFALARMDLKFRGPGEVYGTMQKGFPELKIASLFDYELMKMAKEEAEKLIKKDAELLNWPALKEKLALLNFSNYLTG